MRLPFTETGLEERRSGTIPAAQTCLRPLADRRTSLRSTHPTPVKLTCAGDLSWPTFYVSPRMIRSAEGVSRHVDLRVGRRRALLAIRNFPIARANQSPGAIEGSNHLPRDFRLVFFVSLRCRQCCIRAHESLAHRSENCPVRLDG